MKDPNRVKNGGLSFVIINLGEAREAPHALKALRGSGCLSQDCLVCLHPWRFPPELRWVLVPMRSVRAGCLCVCLALAVFSASPVDASPQPALSVFHAAAGRALDVLELVQTGSQPAEGPQDWNG